MGQVTQPTPGRSPVRTLALVGIALMSSCGAVSFLGSDPSSPRSREARFDRFTREWSLAMLDTAPPLERIGRSENGAEHALAHWDEPGRLQARRSLSWATLKRLDEEFPPSRLDPGRATIARVIEADLRRELGLAPDERARGPLPADRSTPPEGPSPSIESLASTPWSGVLVEAPSILLREHPRHNSRDLDAWWSAIEAIVDRVEAATPIRELSVDVELEVGKRRSVFEQTYEHVVVLAANAGGASALDPFLGPIEEAEGALTAPEVAGRRVVDRRALHRRMRASFGDLADLMNSARASSSFDASVGRRAPIGQALSGDARTSWLDTLERAAGPSMTPARLAASSRAELERLTYELAAVMGLDRPRSLEGTRRVLADIREGRADVPGSSSGQLDRARTPETLWELAAKRLDALVANPPEVLVESDTARPFERPHGRWSPYVPGDLLPASDPRARPSRYLAARRRDPVTPAWLREAEALRYGVPGRAVVDAFDREARSVPTVLRATERPAFEEGWALYAVDAAASESLVPEIDGGFGRLSQELVAHALVVVDVGIHREAWPERQAIDYLLEVTPLPRSAAVDHVVRVLAHPGRAALPAIGLGRFRQAREIARASLRERFDEAAFRRALLEGGVIPISELDARIERWVESFPARTRR